jgi:hypothetical protein
MASVRWSMSHRSSLVPARFPSVENGWQGKPAVKDVDAWDSGPVEEGDVAEVGDSGVPVGGESRGVPVVLGQPGDAGAEHVPGGEVEPAGAGEQGTEPRSGMFGHKRCLHMQLCCSPAYRRCRSRTTKLRPCTSNQVGRGIFGT